MEENCFISNADTDEKELQIVGFDPEVDLDIPGLRKLIKEHEILSQYITVY